MQTLTLLPRSTEKWLACQSLDNQIVVYAADSFRQNRKKVFKGHQIAGYACQVNFSPDGKFLSSGDGDGNIVFWDWKSGRLIKRLRAHKEAVISHEWLPHETVSLARERRVERRADVGFTPRSPRSSLVRGMARSSFG